MMPGDVVTIIRAGMLVEATIIDDCYRFGFNKQTALVRLNHAPSIELEINIQEIYRGQDVQGLAAAGAI